MIIAKYLTIEQGELDDRTLGKDGGVFSKYKTPPAPGIEYTKSKLFAVTQDIKVGDEVWDLFKGVKHGIAEEVHKDFIKLKDVSYAMGRKSGGAVKVLGLLSPNATWVKDGDEIEVSQEFIEEGISYFNEDLNWGLAGIEKELAVKCSQCNTYH